ncbi:MAG: hypothetical protein GH144_02125 [Clostridia bacterium]|jgi:hypothetical protein|nr:hypothetical protein [Clostridia bacterium]
MKRKNQKDGSVYAEKILHRAKVLSLVIKKKITQSQAAKELKLRSDRQIRKLLKKYRKGNYSLSSLIHTKSGEPWNKIDTVIRDKVKGIKEMHPNFTNPHIAYVAERELKERGMLVKLNRTTVRNILLELPDYRPAVVRFRPAKRFEMENVGELVQLDTSSSRSWFFYLGKKLIYCIVCLDDHSRKILAGHFFKSDDVYSNMLVLREVMEKYGVFEVAYTDCDSKFKFNPRKPSMYQTLIVIPDEVITQIKYALLKVGSTLLTHSLGNTRATGKIEKWFQFFQSWFCTEYEFKNLSLSEFDKKFQEFIDFYNNRFHEGIGETPNERFQRALEEGKTRFSSLPEGINLDDIFCLREKRCLKKDNTFSYNGTTYDLTRNRRSITRKAKVELHIHPKKKIRAFYKDEFVQEFPWVKK